MNKTYSICTTFLIFCISLSFGQRQTKESFRSKFGPNYLVGYLSYVPTDYNSKPASKFPLLLFLHGGGEKAWNPQDLNRLDSVKKNGPPMLIEKGMDFPFIVISPQLPFGDWDNIVSEIPPYTTSKPGEFVDEILEKIKSLYRVDLDRVYITGLSIGGAATWEYTQQYPEKIAASIPISGWGDGSKSCNVASNNVAVWAFQGELDGGNSITSLVDQINACKPPTTVNAIATIYPNVEHNAWTRTYDNTATSEDIYKWLMRQSKKPSVINSVLLNYKNIENHSFNNYPSPVSEKLHIEVSDIFSGELAYTISNEYSESLQNGYLLLTDGEKTLDINMSKLNNGIYFCTISGNNLSSTFRVIVMK